MLGQVYAVLAGERRARGKLGTDLDESSQLSSLAPRVHVGSAGSEAVAHPQSAPKMQLHSCRSPEEAVRRFLQPPRQSSAFLLERGVNGGFFSPCINSNSRVNSC